MEPVLTFGLGTNSMVDGLLVLWPDGQSAEIPVPEVDREIRIAWPDRNDKAGLAITEDE
jgi:hypothetical protein